MVMRRSSQPAERGAIPDPPHPAAGAPMVVDHAGCGLSIRLHGPAGAPAVLLLHGAMLDHRSWAPQVRALAGRYRIVVPNLRGHGLSKPMGVFSVAQAAEDAIAVLDRIGVDRVALVGLSLGGVVAQEVAYQHPGRVACLACLETVPVFEIGPGWLEQLGLRAAYPVLQLYGYERLCRRVARSISAREEVRAYVRDAAAMMSRAEFLAMWAGVATAFDRRRRYKYPHPLLIGFGAGDGDGFVARAGRRWAATVPHAALAVFPEAGHCANQDNPEAVNAALLAFLDRHWPAGG